MLCLKYRLSDFANVLCQQCQVSTVRHHFGILLVNHRYRERLLTLLISIKISYTMDATRPSSVREVDSENFDSIWPELQKSMLESTFIALDGEMSGLGSSNTFEKDAEDRYRVLKTAAQSRSLISLGMTCFVLVEQGCSNGAESDNCIVYRTVTYNILTLCGESFTIDPSAVTFLTQHSFDFNKLFSRGLKYAKGTYDSKKESAPSPARKIFDELIRVRKPIVVHNGFGDLIFMYECLYASCPTKLSVFLSDLSEMFPSGIYDTKVIARFFEKLDSSFLEYVVKKFHTENAKAASTSHPHVVVKLTNGSMEDILGPQITPTAKKCLKEICTQFKKYGYCDRYKKGLCDLSHNVTDVIVCEESTSRKRKRKNENEDNSSNSVEKKDDDESRVVDSFMIPCHRAGLDSLFTGFSFAVFTVLHSEQLQMGAAPVSATTFSSVIPNMSDSLKSNLMNRIYFNNKRPMWVTKSHFSKSSLAHEQNILRIFLGLSDFPA